MTSRLGVAGAIAIITLLGFAGFPGHTWLQSDTQIYVPMLERIWDPGALPNDIVATKPHLSFTIYDEVTIALRWLLRAPSFEAPLMLQQIAYRALQVFGVYLLAAALPLAPAMAIAVTAIVSLGATIMGPAVLLIEYEPVPRGFAVALIFLAIGLAAQRRLVWASSAASLAFLYHAPTTIPFWICFFPMIVWPRHWRTWIPLAAAVALIAVSAWFQAGVVERQHFFFRLDPELERLQRLRTSYNWVSGWAGALLWQYVVLWLASLVAYWRVRPRRGRVFLLGLPLIGLLSVPVSYALLEWLKWGIISEIQPARALLFVTAVTIFLSAAAGLRAAERGNLPGAGLWLFFAIAIPTKSRAALPDYPLLLIVAVLASLIVFSIRLRRTAAVAFLLAATYFLIPRQYPPLLSDDLRQLIAFGRERTPKDSMWIFADAGRDLTPGIFRAGAVRSVFVDWKAGGQVNYYRSLADEWWRRWTQVNQLRYRPQANGELREMGIDYLVLPARGQAPGQPLAFRNRTYAVYRLTTK